MKTKNKIFLFFSVGILVLLIFQSLNFGDNEQTIINDENNDILVDNPKGAGNWNLEAIITIDDSATGVDAHNWSWAVAQDWCSGAGIEEDPFLFENITITVNDASAGLAITNSNSTTYFELNNITIVNAGGDGLELNNASNGVVSSSDFNSNGNTGIYMNNVNDTAISLTNCINNTVDGIYAVDSNLNTFTTIDCSGNGRYGLMLASSSNNTITLSDFDDNTEVGLAITEIAEHSNSTDNVIYSNTFENNTINGVDNSTLANQWDNGVNLGNNWDDYEGEDADDDLVGDTPYDLSGSAEAQDNYPYCSDGDEPVAVSVSGNGGDRDLWEPVNPITLAILVGIFFGVFVGILVISKYLRKMF